MGNKSKLEMLVKSENGQETTVDINDENLLAGLTDEQKNVLAGLRTHYQKTAPVHVNGKMKAACQALYLVVGVGAVVSVLGGELYSRLQHDTTPGYCDPVAVRIKQTDLDHVRNAQGRRTDETLLIYKGKKFLLMEQENGQPVVREYDIAPEQTTPVLRTFNE
jgi:hypothetical protein